MKPRFGVRALLPSVTALLASCFTYLPTGGTTPARGAEVVAQLSVPLEVPLGDVTVRRVATAAGRVAYADRDSLVLAAERFTSDVGTDYAALGTSVTIRRARIRDLHERHLSAARTALLIGGGAAALVSIVYSVGPLFGSGAGGTAEPPQRP